MVRNASPLIGNRLEYYTGKGFNRPGVRSRPASQRGNHFMEGSLDALTWNVLYTHAALGQPKD